MSFIHDHPLAVIPVRVAANRQVRPPRTVPKVEFVPVRNYSRPPAFFLVDGGKRERGGGWPGQRWTRAYGPGRESRTGVILKKNS